MNIWSAKGEKVRFLNKNGYDSDREWANRFLNTTDEYEVEDIEVGSWSSKVKLVGIDDWFNTVMFENVNENPKEVENWKYRVNYLPL